MSKTSAMIVRVSDKEREAFEAIAKTRGIKPSALMRECITNCITNSSIAQNCITNSTNVLQSPKPVRTKRIDTPSQAKQVIAALPAKKPIDERKASIRAAMEGVTMSLSDAKAMRLQQFLQHQ